MSACSSAPATKRSGAPSRLDRVSDPFEPDPAFDVDGERPGNEDDDEAIDALPVLAGPPRIVQSPNGRRLPGERRLPLAMTPAVQAAAVAAGGFVAGAAVLGLVHRRQQRATALAQGRRAGRELSRRHGARNGKGQAGEILQVVGSRSLLVDLHLLGGAPTDG
jgi:hypothetical protein